MLARALDRRTWPVLAILASAAMLATAHAFERFAFMGPCQLCLRQREVYWALIAMAVVGLVLGRLKPTPRFLIALNVLVGLVFLVGALVAIYHAGVEWRWWPAPEGCVGGPADVLSGDLGLDERQMTISCLDAPWHMLGLSMAGWNALVSIGLSAVSFAAAFGMGETLAMSGQEPDTPRQAT